MTLPCRSATLTRAAVPSIHLHSPTLSIFLPFFSSSSSVVSLSQLAFLRFLACSYRVWHSTKAKQCVGTVSHSRTQTNTKQRRGVNKVIYRGLCSREDLKTHCIEGERDSKKSGMIVAVCCGTSSERQRSVSGKVAFTVWHQRLLMVC